MMYLPHPVVALCLIVGLSWPVTATGQMAPTGPQETVQAETLLPLEPHTKVYRLTDLNTGETRQVTGVLSQTELEAARWQLVLGDMRRTLLQRGAQGRVDAVRQTQLDEDLIVVFNPPVTVLPPQFTVGETIREQGEVAIYDAQTREQKATGTYTQTVTLLGRSREQTPAGQFTGYHVRSNQNIDTTWADVEVQLDTLYVPNLGRVYQRTYQNVQKLGLFGSETLRKIELMRMPEGYGDYTAAPRQ